MNRTIKFLIFLSIFLMLIIPVFSLAAQDPPTGLVTCTTNCGFNDLMALVNKVIKFILFDLAIPIAAIMFAYAGFLMVTAGGEAAGARTRAKTIFFNTLLGLVLAAAAWLIIRTILSILGYDGTWIGLPLLAL